MVEFSPYLPPGHYQKIAKSILLSFILNPQRTKKLAGKLLNFWGEQRLGQLTLTKAIWFFLGKGDQLLKVEKEQKKSEKFLDLYGSQKAAFKSLKGEVEVFGQEFTDLILCLWMTKQKLGMGRFCKGEFSFWSELLRSYPEINNLIRGPGVSLPRQSNRKKPGRSRRRKAVREAVEA